MAIWALADLHLSFGVPNKKMDVFGQRWVNHDEKIRSNWLKVVKPEDLVLLAGDISWAMKMEEVLPDLEWIDRLPGTKVMIKGNHDYWWASLGKVQGMLPPSIHAIQNTSFQWKNFEIGGARLWDTPEYRFDDVIEIVENPKANLTEHSQNAEEDARIFARELGRLELSLKSFKDPQSTKIVMTHYPPIGKDLKDSSVSRLLEQYGVSACVFGHLHNVFNDRLSFGERQGVRYLYVAGDYVDFDPVKVF